MSLSGLGALGGALAPGMVAAGQNYQQGTRDQRLAQGMLPGTNASANQAADSLGNSPLTDADHPIWNVLGNLTNAQGTYSNDAGNTVPTGTGGLQSALANQAIPTGMSGMQAGGIVTGNFGIPTRRPDFVQGPMQGIMPASTEGQILTMADGGYVSDGFHEQPGITGVPMSGRGASLIEGVQAGQNLGHNFKQLWSQNQKEDLQAQQAGVLESLRPGNPNQGYAPGTDATHPYDQTTLTGQAQNAFHDLFQHIHDNTLHESGQPNNVVGIPDPAAAAAAQGPPKPGADPSAPQAGSTLNAAATTGALPAGSGAGLPPAGSGAGLPPAGSGAGLPPASSAPAGSGAGLPPASSAPAGSGAGLSPAGSGAGLPPASSAPADLAKAAAQQNVTDVTQNTNVQRGIPSDSPAQSGLPPKMPPEAYAKLLDLKARADMAAIKTGEDPVKVMQSSQALINGHFQGQLLKESATAYQAFQNKDMEGVKKAIQNMDYYLPNAQNVHIKTATADDVAQDKTGELAVGDVMHANPFYNMYGHAGEQPYIKVDGNYLASLGNALMDPKVVTNAMAESYKMQQEAQAKHMTAQAALYTGEGRYKWGGAQDTLAQIKLANVASDRALMQSKVDMNEAGAAKDDREPIDRGKNGQMKTPMTVVRQRQNDVSTYIDKALLGQQEAQPQYTPDGKPNPSPLAGKNINNPTLIPTQLKGLTPDQIAQVKQFGGQFAAGNPEMPKEEAAELAARIVRIQSSKNPALKTHPGKDGKPHDNFIPDDPHQPGVAHVWVGNQYRSFYSGPNVIQDPSSATSASRPSQGAEPAEAAPDSSGMMGD